MTGPHSIKPLATTPDYDASLPVCPVPGCGRSPQRRAGRGLSLTHCRYHVQRKSRHGSYWKGTYSAADLRPYKLAAQRYIKAHRNDFWIAAAVKGLRGLMDGAGPWERVVDTFRMTPRRKARAALARMRTAEVPPERLLTIHLAVSGAVAEDPLRPAGDLGEYRKVQVAKAAFRLASGYHSFSYHRYPRSGGLILRHLGNMLEGCCEHVAERHLAAILALKRERYGAREGAVRIGHTG